MDHYERKQVFNAFPSRIKNDPQRKGQPAARSHYFGEYSRYRIQPIHTRFDAVEWFVWDAEHPNSTLNKAEVIRQATTIDEAIKDL